MAEERCDCETTSILLFACAGSSNVGQLSNAAAVELARQGQVRMYCLAGIGAHVSGMVDSAQHVSFCIALDGCPTACARRTLEHAGVRVDKAVVITDLGIEKRHEFEWAREQVDRVAIEAMRNVPAVAARAGADDGEGH
jgi:uncharacterized metal-binding protein